MADEAAAVSSILKVMNMNRGRNALFTNLKIKNSCNQSYNNAFMIKQIFHTLMQKLK